MLFLKNTCFLCRFVCMSSKVKNILIAVLILMVALLGIKLFVSDLFSKKDNSTVDSTIVVQRIQKVMIRSFFIQLIQYLKIHFLP